MRSVGKFWVGLAMVLCFSWALPGAVRAHPDLERAVLASGELEFNTALHHFERALASGTLTRAELTTLYAERALLLHALRRTPDVVADFRWLAAIDPSYELDKRAPPDLRAVWESVRSEAGGASAVELRDESAPGILRVRPVVTGAHPERLLVEAFVRERGGTFRAMDPQHGLEQPAPDGAEVEAYARLTGPGSVVIAEAGSAEAPLQFRAPPVEEAAVGVTARRDGAAGVRRRRILIGTAVAVVAAAALVGALVATSGDEAPDVRLKPVANF